MAGRRKFQGPLSITIWYIIYIYLYMGGGEESTGCEKRRKENTNEDSEIDESRRSPN